MKITNFEFKEMNAKRDSNSVEGLKIGTALNITKIEEIKMNNEYKGTEQFFEVFFDYAVNYEPKIAQILLKGRLVLLGDSKKVKDVLNKWKDKKMDEDFKIAIFNHILSKASLKAIAIEEELKLPSHVPMPMIKAAQVAKK